MSNPLTNLLSSSGPIVAPVDLGAGVIEGSTGRDVELGIEDRPEFSPVTGGRDDGREIGRSGSQGVSDLANLAGVILRNLDVIALGIVGLVIAYTVGQLFTFNFNVGDSTA